MGDRRNVIVDDGSGVSVALYTHWSGSELPRTVAVALDRGRSRWTDTPYLTRIIFSEMVKNALFDETGYGIDPFLSGSDNYTEASPGYDLYIDVKEQMISGFDGEGDTSISLDQFVREYLPTA